MCCFAVVVGESPHINCVSQVCIYARVLCAVWCVESCVSCPVGVYAFGVCGSMMVNTNECALSCRTHHTAHGGTVRRWRKLSVMRRITIVVRRCCCAARNVWDRMKSASCKCTLHSSYNATHPHRLCACGLRTPMQLSMRSCVCLCVCMFVCLYSVHSMRWDA